MVTRIDFSNRTDGRIWILALSLSVVLCGCGRRPDEAPKAAPTVRDGIPNRPEAHPREMETSAAKPAPFPTASGPRADSAASASTERATEGQDPKRAVTTQRKHNSSPATTSDSTQPDSLERQLAALRIPPAWLEEVETQYDTSHPWKDARLEIRRLLSLNTKAARREAIKLTWLYLQEGDIGNGHEYPMYLYLGGEPVWAIRAHEEFLAKPHKEAPDHAYISLASLYTRYGAFEKAKSTLDEAMARLPAPPWRIARQANVHEAFGDLYAAWGKTDLAREHYAEAVGLYPKSNQPYGQHLLKRQAARTQSKLDLLSVRSLADARLRDGRYTHTALGYAGDLHLVLAVREGRIADIQVKHEEKIDQGACVVIPQRIIEKQSLQVDAISGATVTTSAILDAALQCLRKAGLP